MAPKQRRGGYAGGLAAAERAHAPRREPRHVRREERQEVARQGGTGEREPSEHIEDGKVVERDQPLFHHRAKALRLGRGVKNDLRPDAHLLELAEEYAEVPLVGRLGSEL